MATGPASELQSNWRKAKERKAGARPGQQSNGSLETARQLGAIAGAMAGLLVEQGFGRRIVFQLFSVCDR
ncbi:hypothetical protein TRIUR3_28999 [Triticum urartu]|uniref:Uncharacterized protein n=1 Tax=Triticum urartu TaxID=4572 RepID=M7ZTV4_TRIUA|nr:hypothetical protein TRIUR3_28999 [Triticum urartu]